MVSSLLHFARGDVDTISFAAAVATSVVLLRLYSKRFTFLVWVGLSLQPVFWFPDSTRWVAAKIEALSMEVAPSHVFAAVIAIAASTLFSKVVSKLLFGRRTPKYLVNQDALKDSSFQNVLKGATLANLPLVTKELRDGFTAGISRPMETRLAQLKGLRRFFVENEALILEALRSDLGRPEFEGLFYDVLLPISEIDNAIRNVQCWAAPKAVGMSLLTWPSTQWVQQEPQGLVLVISCWNYPVNLALLPVIGAIAAGNVVALKPSLTSPASGKLLRDLLPKYLDPRIVSVLGPFDCTDVACTRAILDNRFDHVFFTGSVKGGRAVMELAAKHLSICTMELGGKNPVFVDATADISLAAKRIIWGRMLNAGQQCVSPDYIICDPSVVDKFCEETKKWIKVFFGKDPKASPDFGRINATQIDRIVDLVQNHGGTLVTGGSFDRATCYVAPTVVRCDTNARIMQDEVFGPILVVLNMPSLDAGLAYVNSREKPLSLYLFSESKEFQDKILLNTSSGGVTINGTLMHAGHPMLPFGGVGHSGYGAYHGKHSFTCFSHAKPVVAKATWHDFGLLTDPFFLYAPWNALKVRILRVVAKFM